MDKINRLLERSARYFGLDGAPPECWDGQASHPDVETTRRRARRTAAPAKPATERDSACNPMRRAFMGRR
jgi:hypothetical protein